MLFDEPASVGLQFFTSNRKKETKSSIRLNLKVSFAESMCSPASVRISRTAINTETRRRAVRTTSGEPRLVTSVEQWWSLCACVRDTHFRCVHWCSVWTTHSGEVLHRVRQLTHSAWHTGRPACVLPAIAAQSVDPLEPARTLKSELPHFYLNTFFKNRLHMMCPLDCDRVLKNTNKKIGRWTNLTRFKLNSSNYLDYNFDQFRPLNSRKSIWTAEKDWHLKNL